MDSGFTLWFQRQHRRLNAVGCFAPSGPVIWCLVKMEGCADSQRNGCRIWKAPVWRKCLPGTLEIAGHYRSLGAADNVADSGFEWTHFAGAGTCALGKEDVYASLLDQPVAEFFQRMAATALSPDWQSVQTGGGKGGDQRIFEKRVTGGDREYMPEPALRQNRCEHDGVEMAPVVGDHYERWPGEVFPAFDPESMIEAKIDSGESSPGKGCQHGNQSRFPAETALPVVARQAEIVSGFVIPVGWHELMSGQNPYGLIYTDSPEIANVVESGGGDEQQAVEPV